LFLVVLSWPFPRARYTVARLLEFYVANSRTLDVDRIVRTNREIRQSRLSDRRNPETETDRDVPEHIFERSTEMILLEALSCAKLPGDFTTEV
jgi:hypothetical protein